MLLRLYAPVSLAVKYPPHSTPTRRAAESRTVQLSQCQTTTKGPAPWFTGVVDVDAIARHRGDDSVTPPADSN